MTGAEQARARREILATLITVCGNDPYPDDPRWTPWTRFGEPASRKVDALADALSAAEAALRERTEELHRCRADYHAKVIALQAALREAREALRSVESAYENWSKGFGTQTSIELAVEKARAVLARAGEEA